MQRPFVIVLPFEGLEEADDPGAGAGAVAVVPEGAFRARDQPPAVLPRRRRHLPVQPHEHHLVRPARLRLIGVEHDRRRHLRESTHNGCGMTAATGASERVSTRINGLQKFPFASRVE